MLKLFISPLLMLQRSPLPVCPEDCGDNLPPVEFDECAPEINEGRIDYIYLTNVGNPLVDWTDPVEWNNRLDNTASAPDSILRLTVTGEKPAPTANEQEISLGRKIVANKTHILNYTIDETNDINHEFIRQLECSGQFLAWYETSGGLMFGGTEGITVSMTGDMIIPLSVEELINFSGKLEWKAKFTEERIISPI